MLGILLFVSSTLSPNFDMPISENPILASEFIYETAPFPSCHASTIVEAKNGRLVAAWFGGTAESHPDVAIYSSLYINGKWSAPREIADGKVGKKQFACYNPVLFQPRNGPMMMFYKVGTGPRSWWGRMCTSNDDGQTWSRPHDFPHGYLGPIKNKPIEYEGGILCPSSNEEFGWQVHFEKTNDLGATWSKTEPLNDSRVIGAIQPSILEMGGEHLKAIGRTQQGSIFSIDSHDGGVSWGAMKLIDLPNPNSGTDAVRLHDGRYLLVYNHSHTHRTPLNVALSTDGEHWRSTVVLENTPGEYSYPAVIQASDGLIHITYTWHRERIKHVVLDPKLLK